MCADVSWTCRHPPATGVQWLSPVGRIVVDAVNRETEEPEMSKAPRDRLEGFYAIHDQRLALHSTRSV